MAIRNLPCIINPCTVAVTLGLMGAISTALGSVMYSDEKNLGANTLSAFTGCVVNGAIAGSLSRFIVYDDRPAAPDEIRFDPAFVSSLFIISAFFAGPVMGQAVLGQRISREVTAQESLGFAFINVSYIIAVLAAHYCCPSKRTQCCSTLFSRSRPNALLTADLINNEQLTSGLPNNEQLPSGLSNNV